MKPVNKNAVVAIPITKLSAAGTAYVASFDTKGHNFANVYLSAFNASACASGLVSSVILKESDTLTSGSSMTSIVAFTGGTATSTSVGFVIGGDTANTGATGLLELQVDLRNRKRDLGLYVVGDQGATSYVAGAIVMSPDKSADTAALKAVTNNDSTAATIKTVVAG